MKEFLSENGVDFAFFDISQDLGALKRFLKIRETNSIYDPVKEKGGIGIPTVIIDNKVMIDFEKEKLLEMIE